jgi:hypothetical protein
LHNTTNVAQGVLLECCLQKNNLDMPDTPMHEDEEETVDVYDGHSNVLIAKFGTGDTGANILEELHSHPGPGRLVRFSNQVTVTKGAKAVRAGKYSYYRTVGKQPCTAAATLIGWAE